MTAHPLRTSSALLGAHVLELTPSALAMIARLRDGVGTTSGAALRISGGGTAPGLHMSLAGQPDPDDVVLIEPEATIFLDPVAAARLDHELLDARVDERGSAFFLGPPDR